MRRRSHYDAAIGMGSVCACTQALRMAGLQYLSLPFDWIGGPGPVFKAKMMRDNFAGWWTSDGWTRLPDPPHSMNPCWKDRWGFTPIHDFHNGLSFEEELPIVRARYLRRIDRMTGLIDAAKRVLIVYLETPRFGKVGADDPGEVRRILNERWPNVSFDVLVLKYAEKVPFENRIEERGEGWRSVVYDYRDYKEEDWAADAAAIARWLRADYSVSDYRTAAEKKAWKTKPRQDEYARYNVHNVFEYLYVKLQFKIFKHLRTSLERRGVLGV